MKKTAKIITHAREIGLGKDCFKRMKSDGSIKNLCEMYFDGSDWAMEKDFPTLSMLREFKEVENHGLFTDFSGTIEKMRQMAFFGKSDVEIIANGFDVQEIYIRHDSKVIIKANGHSKIFVNVLDNAVLNVVCGDIADVTVYSYGKLENITTGGNGIVKVIPSTFDK